MSKENWDNKMIEEDKIKVDVDKAWMNVHGRLKREELIPTYADGRDFRISIPFALRLAAAVVLFGGLATLTYLAVTPAERSVRMAANATTGQKFGLTLPDGSLIDLNAGSKIKYKLRRSGVRMVNLKGEAFFDVRADELRPFVIKAGDGTVRVTGTSFSVRTVPGANRIEVFVESGNVQFYRSGKQDRILSLKAGQSGILERNKLILNDIPDENQNSWKTRKLIFRDTRLGDVAGVLNRTYSQNILFTNEALEDCLFTGTFDEQHIDSVIRVIQVAFDLELEQKRKAYVLSGDGCN